DKRQRNQDLKNALRLHGSNSWKHIREGAETASTRRVVQIRNAELSEGASGRASRETRKQREVRRNAQMFCAPAAHLFHQRNQVAAGFREGIGDLWRDVACRFSDNDTVFCEFAEL